MVLAPREQNSMESSGAVDPAAQVSSTVKEVAQGSSWHQDPKADVEPRRHVIQEIVKLLKTCKPAFDQREEKLVDLARRLEVALYKQSRSKEEYMDPSTLRQRVRELAKQSAAHHSAGVPSNQPEQHQAEARQNSEQQPPHAYQAASSLHQPEQVQKVSTTVRLKVKPPQPQGEGKDPEEEREHREIILKQRQQRLLLLRHASRCNAPEGKCEKTDLCAPMKQLWKHIAGCKEARCSVPHCVSSRYVLSHYHRCKKEDCPVCKPVRMKSAREKMLTMRPDYRTQGGEASGDGTYSLGRSNSVIIRGAGQPPPAYRQQGLSKAEYLRYRKINPDAIDPTKARHCWSGTGPSLPFSMDRLRVEAHIDSLRVERIQINVRTLLRRLVEHKHNKGVFNEPVDPVALRIPDYPRIVKNPMDLGTIRKRLDGGYYKELEQFKSDVCLVFKNGMLFNPPENEIHVRAQTLLRLAESEFPRIENKVERNGRRRGEPCQLCRQQDCEQCPLCERGCIPFEPKLLICAGMCQQRIQRGSIYYTGVGYNYCWCSDCYDKSPGERVVVNGQHYPKTMLIRKKNNELYGEPWVSCDRCERWVHQVCALFNSRKNSLMSAQEYICPLCLIEESELGEAERTADPGKSEPERGEEGNERKRKSEEMDVDSDNDNGEKRVEEETKEGEESKAKDGVDAKGKYEHFVLPAGKKVPGAMELPHSRLGVFLEGYLRRKIEEFQAADREKAGIEECNLGPPSDKLHVRVLTNFDQDCKVKPFVKKLMPEYPEVLPYRSKCIFLFQELDGVDVLFFAMFVQEYGSDCPEPNRRKLYIAYLDSVNYFRPRRMRTTIYHQLLLGYLEYARRDGYTSAYIWACPPPNKRDDYIIHCHPEDQRMQTSERLRRWYHHMIKKGATDGIILSSCALHDEHFDGSKRSSNSKKNGKTSKSKKRQDSSKKSRSKKGKEDKKDPLGARLVSQPSSSNIGGSIDDESEEALLAGIPEVDDQGDLGEDMEEEKTQAEPPDDSGAAVSSSSNLNAVDCMMDDSVGTTLIEAGNGLRAGDDKMTMQDLERRRRSKLAALGNLPYFDGDYWPQEAEEVAKERALKKQQQEDIDAGRMKRKRRRSGNPDGPYAGPGGAARAAQDLTANLTEQERLEYRKILMNRISDQLDSMKDDFFVVKMAHECARCGHYLLRGRWECRNPKCLEISGFNKPCPFAICNKCYISEAQRPVDLQHGGGCIAKGKAGQPRSEKTESDNEAGKDQIRIDVNEELKRQEREKKKREEEEKKKDEEEGRKKTKGKSNDDQATKRIKNEEPSTSAPKKDDNESDSTMEVDEENANATNAQEKKSGDVVEGKEAEDTASKLIKTEPEQISNPATTASSSSSEKKPSTEEEEKKKAEEEEAKKKHAEEEAERKHKAEEEAEELRENFAFWKKQPLEPARPRPEFDAEDHALHYVDENLPVNTPDHDRIRRNHLLETRHAFLSLCTGNRYQFDQLRRAKHSTMMVLYHMHNPDAPAHLYTCFECHTDILAGKRYHCDICNGGDFDVCGKCNSQIRHPHPLTPHLITRGIQAETSEAQRLQRVVEQQRVRKHSLSLFLQALVHSATCDDDYCNEAPCKKMKGLLRHRMNCTVRVRGGCEICRRVLCLVQMHARSCKIPSCRVPHCEDLKAHIRQQLAQQRQAQMQAQERARLGQSSQMQVSNVVKTEEQAGTAVFPSTSTSAQTQPTQGALAQPMDVDETATASSSDFAAQHPPTNIPQS